MGPNMIFRQLFDRESCTYTYLLADEQTREAVLIDPVRELIDRDAQVVSELGLTLTHTLETHVHADHVTGSGLLRQKLGSKSVLSARGGAPCVDVAVEHGDVVTFGNHRIEVRATPGHTNTCTSYYVPEMGAIFTGDALFIRGCGRTDFQEGSPETLYQSIHEQIFSLPDSTSIYPGHDYKGRTVSTVGEEKAWNPRLGGGKTIGEFAGIMNNLNLSPPKKLHEAVPANQRCGLPLPVTGEGAVKIAGWAPIIRSQEGVPEVTVAWVAANSGSFRLVDVREQAEWTGPLGHIDGAELVPLKTVADALVGADRMAPVVVLCRSGGRSGTAAQLLESMGFAKVASMAGGMTTWNDSSLPIASV
jgi:sulfur dioxygenase